MSLSDQDKANFETLRDAIRNGDAALLECQFLSTGQPTPVICAVNRHLDNSLEFVPIAQLFTRNPYTVLTPPDPDSPGQAPEN